MRVSTRLSETAALSTKIMMVCLFLIASSGCGWLLNTLTPDEPVVYLSVEEVLSDTEIIGKQISIFGVVLEDTIRIHSDEQKILFELAHVPTELSDISEQQNAIQDAIKNPNVRRITVSIDGVYLPEVRDRIVVVEGILAQDRIFYADRLMVHD